VNEGQAVDLIEETIRHVRAAGSTKLVWHTGDRVSARFMDWYLASCGFELGDGPEPTPPRRDPRTCGFPARCRGAPPGAEGLLEGVLVGKQRLPQSPRSPRSSWRVPGRPSRLVVTAGNVTMRSEIRRVPPLHWTSPGARAAHGVKLHLCQERPASLPYWSHGATGFRSTG
jgi:hypothetical protein